MRKLKRAHQKQTRERKKFRRRAVAAGTAAAITLGAGVSLHKALAAYTADLHELPVSQDADADLLANTEEVTIGYHAFKGDQNRNEIPDGVELAKLCAGVINQLPVWEYPYQDPEPNETYKLIEPYLGWETCDICGERLNMGFWRIKNPQLGLSMDVYEITRHYMSHGSFSYAGSVHHSGRIDVASLVEVLEIPKRCGDLGTEFLAGDLNDDCEVNLADLGKLTERWLRDCSYFGTPYILGDLNEDCEIDLTDFAGLADQWQQCTDPNE